MTALSIFRWFEAPQLRSPDLRRRARALWIVSWPFFAVVLVILGIAVMVEPQTAARRATTIASVGILITILHGISRSGRPLLASWMLVIGLSILVTQRAWITGGIHAPVSVFYVMFIVMAGVLIGLRGGLVTAFVCILGSIVLTVGTIAGWLTRPVGAGSPVGAFVFVILAIGLATVINALIVQRPRQEAVSSDAIRMLVHDMRSPMHVLMAHLELLKEDVRGESVKDLENALSGAETLNRMTSSLLDIGRLESGKMPVRLEMTNISELARRVVENFRVLQPGRDMQVESLCEWPCSCDPDLTRRVIENLVGNAMKHTPIDAPVRVIVSGSSDRIYLGVHDEGQGIPKEKREMIFEAFHSDSTQSVAEYGSSGLGLAFCKLAVEAQGGTIRVEDGSSGGSAFIVELLRG
jgi:signal transduction histidine kinase